MLDKYTVTLRGESFTLYSDQIEFDAPNYFSDLFLGDFSESQTRTAELSRSPDLFRIVISYLSGYSVLPLSPKVVPREMTAVTARENLLLDAEYYGLQGLVKILSNVPTPPRFSTACDAFFLGRQAVDFEDVVRGKLPTGVTFDERGVGMMRGETWLAAPLLALDTLLVVDSEYKFSVRYLTFALTSPSIQTFLAHPFVESESKPLGIDSLPRQALKCSVLASANIRVIGVDASGREFTARMESGRNLKEKYPIDAPLQEVFKVEDFRYLFMGEKILFTITGGTAQTGMRVNVIAAQLTSRYAAARNFL